MIDACLTSTGLSAEVTKNLVVAAETCCEEDIYHFDDIERFFLVSCLALWYAASMSNAFNINATDDVLCTVHTHTHTDHRHVRKGNFNQAEKYEAIATGN